MEQTPETHDEQIYQPPPGEKQLTARAVITGCAIGGVVTAMNLYLGLRIGWSVGGSLLAAILGYAMFSASRNKLSVLETNITQTSGSGAGTMASAAGMLAPIPAMEMLGYEIPIWALFLWSAAVAYLGVNFAVPLRRQYVLVDKLRFPTGTATANTIVAMHATAGETVAKARALLIVALIAFCYFVPTQWIPALEQPPIHDWLGIGVLTSMAAWTFSITISPMLFGAGLLAGPRVGISMLLGAICGWGVLGYIAQQQGWAPHENPMVIHRAAEDIWGARGWILWPGVGIMVGDALMSLGLSWRTFVSALQGARAALRDSTNPAGADDVPNAWWTTGLLVASCATIVVGYLAFDIPPLLAIVAILLSAILANVAVRSTGETDINPIGGMGKVTQLAFGGLSSSMSDNLMGAAVTGAGASQAGDMMQDLKTGYMLGASPRKQYIAQLIGIVAGVCFAVPLYLLFKHAYDIGGTELPAPAAIAWKAVAEVLAKGFDALPPMAHWAGLGGVLFGAILPILRKLFPKAAPYTPSGLAFGIAFIVQAYYAIPMFAGAMALVLWRKIDPDGCNRLVFAVASGLVVGEGLAGVVKAVITAVGSFL